MSVCTSQIRNPGHVCRVNHRLTVEALALLSARHARQALLLHHHSKSPATLALRDSFLPLARRTACLAGLATILGRPTLAAALSVPKAHTQLEISRLAAKPARSPRRQ